MATTYDFPDVYIERQPYSEGINIAVSGAYIGGFIGKAERGVKNTPVLITSWAQYVNTFAYGMDSPFIANSYLAYAVYGFFQNGGSSCYVMNASDGKEVPASATLCGMTAYASDKGLWGNKISLDVTAMTDDEDEGEDETAESKFVLNVYYGDSASDDTKVESFEGVTNTTVVDAVNAASNFVTIQVGADDVELAATTATTLTGGKDGGVPVYSDILPLWDNVEGLAMLSLTDSGAKADVKLLLDYCTKREDVQAVITSESAATSVDEVAALSKYCKNTRGNLFYPWIQVVDPLTSTVIDVPNVGHAQGLVVRVTTNTGLYQVPAGVDAVINGAVGLSTELDKTQAGKLNTSNVCCIINKKGYGIVNWGGRSLFEGGRYITSILLETKIARDLYDGLQPYIFQPNNSMTWQKVTKTLEVYMENLWNSGAFEGSTAASAFKVVCDGTTNTADTIAKKQLNATVSYRERDCAEFIVIKLSRDLS